MCKASLCKSVWREKRHRAKASVCKRLLIAKHACQHFKSARFYWRSYSDCHSGASAGATLLCGEKRYQAVDV